MVRKFLRRIGQLFSRFEIGGLIGIILSIFYTIFSISQVTNWILFLFTLVIITIVAALVFFLMGEFFLWLSHWNSISIKEIKSASRSLDIEITNNDYEDFTNLAVRLERLTYFGHSEDFSIEQQSRIFPYGIDNEENKIPTGKKATIKIAHVSRVATDKVAIEFLTKDAITDNQFYDLNELFEVQPKNKRGEWLGAIYEFVVEISGKFGEENFSRWYLASLNYQVETRDRISDLQVTLQWVKLENYSKRKEMNRNKKIRTSEVMTKDKFWKALNLKA